MKIFNIKLDIHKIRYIFIFLIILLFTIFLFSIIINTKTIIMTNRVNNEKPYRLTLNILFLTPENTVLKYFIVIIFYCVFAVNNSREWYYFVGSTFLGSSFLLNLNNSLKCCRLFLHMKPTPYSLVLPSNQS